jgi:hypothetical protein
MIAKTMPKSPSKDHIKQFEHGHTRGLNNHKAILVDWTAPWSSPWNHEALSTIAAGYIEAIEARNYPSIRAAPKKTMKELVDICLDKLISTRSKYKQSFTMDTKAIEAQAWKNAKKRHTNTRRHGVCINIIYHMY